MLTKGSSSALAQVSSVAGQQVTFSGGDSLLLNQTAAADGTLARPPQHRAPDAPSPVLHADDGDAHPDDQLLPRCTADPLHPRLIRRINNGSADHLRQHARHCCRLRHREPAHHLRHGRRRDEPANVRMTAADLQGTGACAPRACSPNQIRKVNILLSGDRALRCAARGSSSATRSSTQVSLRSLAFVDRYR